MTGFSRLSLTVALCWLTVSTAVAHPEDDFCTADSGLDPALCAALAESDRTRVPDISQNSQSMVDAGQLARMKNSVKLERPWWATAALYIKLGYEHILPKGLDHILFVLALFLASTRLKPLVIQISVFTLAHTITLGLAAAGWVSLPATMVEPLIALSIAFVAIENLFSKDMRPWRPLIVFGFGLFHGMGFASVLLNLGLPPDQFLTALVGFNVGVELGQMSVVLAAWLLLRHWFGRDWYRARIVIPASFLIAVTGTWWAIQRIYLL